MPQMSPMMWLYLFIYFLSIYMIMIIMIYNLYLIKIPKWNYFSLEMIHKFFLKW